MKVIDFCDVAGGVVGLEFLLPQPVTVIKTVKLSVATMSFKEDFNTIL